MKTPVISEYTIDGDPRQAGCDDIRIARATQKSGRERWAVRQMGDCLNKQGEWEFEPTPSSRDAAFLERCRFDSADEAFAACCVTGIANKPADAAPEDLGAAVQRAFATLPGTSAPPSRPSHMLDVMREALDGSAYRSSEALASLVKQYETPLATTVHKEAGEFYAAVAALVKSEKVDSK